MRREAALALSLAAVSGIFAAFGTYGWMPEQANLTKVEYIPAGPSIPLTTVVVVKEDLGFGEAVTKEKLIEAQWPEESIPKGSFKTLTDLFAEQESRVVLEALRSGEPVLRGKVTGPGQRATLSTMLQDGMKAVAMRVNDVAGVGGFIMPGDRVDVFMTNENKDADGLKKKMEEGQYTGAYTDLLLQNIRVLAVDQLADPKKDAPLVARTVTVEARLEEAQKITLAATVGTLSLVLRESGSAASSGTSRRVKISDLGDSGDNNRIATFQPTNTVAPSEAAVSGEGDGANLHDTGPALAKINVVRSIEQKEYSVRRVNSAE